MSVRRFMTIRERLVELYTTITERTYQVGLPSEQLYSLDQLNNYQKAYPLIGLDRFQETGPRPVTIESMSIAIRNYGHHVSLGFANPKKDVMEVYKIIQEYIQLWVELKTDWPYLPAIQVQELKDLEELARYIFGWHREYYLQEINASFGGKTADQLTLADVLAGSMLNGTDPRETLSFVSHLDLYKANMDSNDLIPTGIIRHQEMSVEDVVAGMRSSFGIGEMGG